MLRKTLLTLIFLLPLAAGADQASDQAITDTLKRNIRMVRHLALNPLLVDAVRRQNSAALDMATIRERDRAWEDAGRLTGLKSEMKEGYHSLMMRRFIDGNQEFNKAVLTDSQGANVAAYPLAGDYWQGDESDWQKAFNEGAGQVYISPLEQDPATGVISTSIAAPVQSRNETVGVLLVAVQLNAGR